MVADKAIVWICCPDSSKSLRGVMILQENCIKMAGENGRGFAIKKTHNLLVMGYLSGAGEQIRTADPHVGNVML